MIIRFKFLNSAARFQSLATQSRWYACASGRAWNSGFRVWEVKGLGFRVWVGKGKGLRDLQGSSGNILAPALGFRGVR